MTRTIALLGLVTVVWACEKDSRPDTAPEASRVKVPAEEPETPPVAFAVHLLIRVQRRYCSRVAGYALGTTRPNYREIVGLFGDRRCAILLPRVVVDRVSPIVTPRFERDFRVHTNLFRRSGVCPLC